MLMGLGYKLLHILLSVLALVVLRRIHFFQFLSNLFHLCERHVQGYITVRIKREIVPGRIQAPNFLIMRRVLYGCAAPVEWTKLSDNVLVEKSGYLKTTENCQMLPLCSKLRSPPFLSLEFP